MVPYPLSQKPSGIPALAFRPPNRPQHVSAASVSVATEVSFMASKPPVTSWKVGMSNSLTAYGMCWATRA